MNRPVLTDRIALLLLGVGIILVFLPLFFPTLSIIATPDFGRSDAWHFSFPTKFALAQALKQGTLPLWEPNLSGGFPLFAEGQTGALFFPNMLLFRLLPVVLAYNLALTGAIAGLAFGTYAYVRIIKRSPEAAFFAALVFAFSGLPVLQLPHITLLQGMSLLPVIASLGLLFFLRFSWLYVPVFAVLLSQQIFAGFPQATFITLFFVFVQSVFFAMRARSLRPVIGILLGIGLGIAIGAIQLLPSYEFLTQIDGSSGFDFATTTYFSMPPVHFKTFLFPYALGNPRLGTYAPFYLFDGSVFWENTAYLGIVPLLLVLYYLIREKKSVWKFFLVATLAVSTVLALGKFAPTYIVYIFWPFSLFRVPSRFLWITAFTLSVLSALGIDTVLAVFKRYMARCAVFLILSAVSGAQLYAAWHGYHSVVPATTVKPSPFARFLPKTTRILTPDIGYRYSEAFKKGWQDTTPFDAYTAIPMPDSNLISGLGSHETYAGRFLKRTTLADSLLYSSLAITPREATVSAQGQNMLSFYGITALIMTEPLTAPGLDKTASFPLTADREAGLYINPGAVPRFRIVESATAAATIKEVSEITRSNGFNPMDSVILSRQDLGTTVDIGTVFSQKKTDDAAHRVQVLVDSPTRIVLAVRAGAFPAFLISTDTYYPGWVAFVDGVKTPILPANISQRAIRIEPGNHTVEMVYQPNPLRIGAWISAIALALTVGLGVFLVFASPIRTGSIIHPLSSRRRGNRGQ